MGKTRRIFIMTAVVLVSLLGIGNILTQGQQSAQAADREKITIGLAPTQLTALVIIAAEQGFFTAEGLDAEIRDFPMGDEATDAMFKGEVDLVTVAETAFVLRALAGHKFSAIATIGSSENESTIIARRDKGIQRPEDLRGKRVATHKAVSVHFFLHLFLLKHGLSEKDVLLSFKRGSELPDALARGEIDAFSLREPFISKAQALLGDKAVIFTEPGLYLKTFHVVALNSFILKRPETIKKVLRALMKAEEFQGKQPEKTLEIVSRKLKINKEAAAVSLRDSNLKVSLEQSFLLSLDDEARWAVQARLTDKTDIPNFLDFIHQESLKAVKPEAVTIIR